MHRLFDSLRDGVLSLKDEQEEEDGKPGIRSESEVKFRQR